MSAGERWCAPLHITRTSVSDVGLHVPLLATTLRPRTDGTLLCRPEPRVRTLPLLWPSRAPLAGSRRVPALLRPPPCPQSHMPQGLRCCQEQHSSFVGTPLFSASAFCFGFLQTTRKGQKRDCFKEARCSNTGDGNEHRWTWSSR